LSALVASFGVHVQHGLGVNTSLLFEQHNDVRGTELEVSKLFTLLDESTFFSSHLDGRNLTHTDGDDGNVANITLNAMLLSELLISVDQQDTSGLSEFVTSLSVIGGIEVTINDLGLKIDFADDVSAVFDFAGNCRVESMVGEGVQEPMGEDTSIESLFDFW